MADPSLLDAETMQASKAWQGNETVSSSSVHDENVTTTIIGRNPTRLPATMLLHPSVASADPRKTTVADEEEVQYDPRHPSGYDSPPLQKASRRQHTGSIRRGLTMDDQNKQNGRRGERNEDEARYAPHALHSPAVSWHEIGVYPPPPPPPPPPSSIASRTVHPPPPCRPSSNAPPTHFFAPFTHVSRPASASMAPLQHSTSQDGAKVGRSNGQTLLSDESLAVQDYGAHTVDHPAVDRQANGKFRDEQPISMPIPTIPGQEAINAAGNLHNQLYNQTQSQILPSGTVNHMPIPTVNGVAVQLDMANSANGMHQHVQERVQQMPEPTVNGLPIHALSLSPRKENSTEVKNRLSSLHSVPDGNHHPFQSSHPVFPLPVAPPHRPSTPPPAARTTPLAGHYVPPSTRYPSSLHTRSWTDIDSAATTAGALETGTIASSTAVDPQNRGKHRLIDAVRAIREGLGWLPAKYLEQINREELKELVMKAVEGVETSQEKDSEKEQENGRQHRDENGTWTHANRRNTTSTWQESDGDTVRPTTQGLPLAFGMPASRQQAPMSSHQWFEQAGGGLLPPGWNAEFDFQNQAWYFINVNIDPPLTTWEDPRTVLRPSAMPIHNAQPNMTTATGLPLPSAPVLNGTWTGDAEYARTMPWPAARPPVGCISDPATARAHADWYAKVFAGYEAHRQYKYGQKGPVAAEIDSERKRVRRLHRAQSLIEEASRRLHETNTGSPSEHKERERKAAEVDLARARGMMDRIRRQDNARRDTLPPWLADYQGVTRGFEPPSDRPRTHYVDAPPVMPAGGMLFERQVPPSWPFAPPLQPQRLPTSYPPGTTNVPLHQTMPFGAPPLAGQSRDGLRLPSSMSMPTAYPIPPGTKYKGSSVPTPYGMPEVCFAWDMLLRSTTATDKLAARPTYQSGLNPSMMAGPTMPGAF